MSKKRNETKQNMCVQHITVHFFHILFKPRKRKHMLLLYHLTGHINTIRHHFFSKGDTHTVSYYLSWTYIYVYSVFIYYTFLLLLFQLLVLLLILFFFLLSCPCEFCLNLRSKHDVREDGILIYVTFLVTRIA